jgi:hypothetical protein
MLFADVIGIALTIIGFLLSLQGLWLLCRALWPNRVRRTAERCGTARIAALLLGIPITVCTLGIAGAIARRGGTPGQIVGWMIASLFLLYAGTGMSGFVTFVGERLPSPADSLRPWWATVRGGTAVQLAMLFPVIGWFVLLPVVLMLGVGAITLSFFGKPRREDLRSALAANRGFIVQQSVDEVAMRQPQETGV